MNNWFRNTGAVMALIGLSFALAGCARDFDKTSTAGHTMHDEQHASGSSPRGSEVFDVAAPQKITIDNFTFSPAELTVPKGTKVTWINHDDVPHTATSTARPKVFDSGTLDTDAEFSFVFSAPGPYEYFCAVHPKMTGHITVK
jgi:plastocyanin